MARPASQCLLVLLLLDCALSETLPQEVVLRGCIGSDVKQAVWVGDYIYAVTGCGLSVYTSSWEHVTRVLSDEITVGAFNLYVVLPGHPPRFIDHRGGVVAVANGHGGLVILNASNPAAPTKMLTHNPLGDSEACYSVLLLEPDSKEEGARPDALLMLVGLTSNVRSPGLFLFYNLSSLYNATDPSLKNILEGDLSNDITYLVQIRDVAMRTPIDYMDGNLFYYTGPYPTVSTKEATDTFGGYQFAIGAHGVNRTETEERMLPLESDILITWNATALCFCHIKPDPPFRIFLPVISCSSIGSLFDGFTPQSVNMWRLDSTLLVTDFVGSGRAHAVLVNVSDLYHPQVLRPLYAGQQQRNGGIVSLHHNGSHALVVAEAADSDPDQVVSVVDYRADRAVHHAHPLPGSCLAVAEGRGGGGAALLMSFGRGTFRAYDMRDPASPLLRYTVRDTRLHGVTDCFYASGVAMLKAVGEGNHTAMFYRVDSAGAELHTASVLHEGAGTSSCVLYDTGDDGLRLAFGVDHSGVYGTLAIYTFSLPDGLTLSDSWTVNDIYMGSLTLRALRATVLQHGQGALLFADNMFISFNNMSVQQFSLYTSVYERWENVMVSERMSTVDLMYAFVNVPVPGRSRILSTYQLLSYDTQTFRESLDLGQPVDLSRRAVLSDDLLYYITIDEELRNLAYSTRSGFVVCNTLSSEGTTVHARYHSRMRVADSLAVGTDGFVYLVSEGGLQVTQMQRSVPVFSPAPASGGVPGTAGGTPVLHLRPGRTGSSEMVALAVQAALTVGLTAAVLVLLQVWFRQKRAPVKFESSIAKSSIVTHDGSEATRLRLQS